MKPHILLIILFFSHLNTIYSQDIIIYENKLYLVDYSSLKSGINKIKLSAIKQSPLDKTYYFNKGINYPLDTIMELINPNSKKPPIPNFTRQFQPILAENYPPIYLTYFGSSNTNNFNNIDEFNTLARNNYRFDSCFIDLHYYLNDFNKISSANSKDTCVYYCDFSLNINNSYINHFTILQKEINNGKYADNCLNKLIFKNQVKFKNCNINDLFFSITGHSKPPNIIFEDTVIFNNLYNYSKLKLDFCSFKKPVRITFKEFYFSDLRNNIFKKGNMSSYAIFQSEFKNNFNSHGANNISILNSVFNGPAIFYDKPFAGVINNCNFISDLVLSDFALTRLELIDLNLFNNFEIGYTGLVIDSLYFINNLQEIHFIRNNFTFLNSHTNFSKLNPSLEQLNKTVFLFSDFYDHQNKKRSKYIMTDANVYRAEVFLNQIQQFISRNTNNEHLKNEVEERIEYQIKVNELRNCSTNLNLSTIFNFIYKWFLYLTVNFGYNGTAQFLCSVLLIVFIFALIYTLKFKNNVLNYIQFENVFPNEDQVEKEGPGIKSFFISFLASIAFSLYIFISFRFPFKFFNFKKSLLIITLFNWLIGLVFLLVYIFQIASKYEFLQGLI